MSMEDQDRGVRLTRESDRPLGGPGENWNVPLILAMTVVVAAVGTSLWSKSRSSQTASKPLPSAQETSEPVGERPAVRAISPNHLAEYVDVCRGEAGWQRRDAHTGRLLTQDRLAEGWLVHLQLHGQTSTWIAVDSSNQLQLSHGEQLVWQSPLPGQQRNERLTSCSLCAARSLAAATSKSGTLWLLEFDETSATIRGRYELEAPLASASISPAGDRLLLITGRHEILLWNLAEAQIERRLQGEEVGVRFAAWSGDGRRFVTFGSNRKVEVRDAAGGLVRAMELTSNAVVAAALSQDGSRLAVGDGTVLRLWQVDSESEASSLDGHESLITALAFDDETRALFSGDMQGILRRWALLDHREVWMSR